MKSYFSSMIRTPISWSNISRMIDYHINCGCIYVDTPWVVPEYVKNITYKGEDSNILINGLTLVGSAEQGFIYYQINDGLEDDQHYISCSPCFRNEDPVTDLHRRYFMKVEMFRPIGFSLNHTVLMEIVNRCKFGFADLLGIQKDDIRIDETRDGYDLMLNGYEIGSYYYRKYEHDGKEFRYVCGTAIAEPRLSVAAN